MLFADTTFAPLLARIAPRIARHVRAVVSCAIPTHMPDVTLPPGMALLCYETLIEAAGEDFDWPSFDENTAASLCYTSGTTGRPKGVLYSHRSTLLHAYGVNLGDVLALRAVDRVLPVVPMFHVNAWGLPYAAPMSGRGTGAAGPASGRRQPRRLHGRGAGELHRRRADGMAWAARPHGEDGRAAAGAEAA